MNIYLDFDGTVVEHEYPKIGRYVPDSLRVVERLQKEGHKIILNTYRADCNDGTLEMAISFIHMHRENKIVLDEVTKSKMHPPHWDSSGNTDVLFIDDAAFGMPLLPSAIVKRDMVDWKTVEKQLEDAGILTKSKEIANG